MVVTLAVTVSTFVLPVTASAASGRVGLDTSLDTEAANIINSVLHNYLKPTMKLTVICDKYGIDPDDMLPGVVAFYNEVVQGHGNGHLGVKSLTTLNDFVSTCDANFGAVHLSGIASFFNAFFSASESAVSGLIQGSEGKLMSMVFGEMADAFGKVSFWEDILGLEPPKFEIRYGRTAGYGRIYDAANDLWIVDTSGRYSCCEAVGDTPDFDYVWVPYSDALFALHSGTVTLVSDYRLNLSASDAQGAGYSCAVNSVMNVEGDGLEYRWVQGKIDGQAYVLGHEQNGQSVIYVNRPTSNQLEQDSDRDYQDNDFDTDLYYIIDPDGNFIPTSGLNYDASTTTYNSSYVTFNDSFNTYITNTYTWTYHINYTSITYIGQTEEYDKHYELYYNLPDGRSSADLTREELEQLNVSVDVIPYGRSADDTSLRSLYHFDGDTKDCSYWNYCTDFVWNKGASITYMDAGTFEGALYLDETEHDFTITLPSAIGSGDFTVQWRYYQSATPTPQTDSYVSSGLDTLLQMSGSQFLNGSGTALAATPVGTWGELAIMRDSGTLYYYLNGVCMGSAANSDALPNELLFHFGSSQQTYKYFDELRVLNYALQTEGKSYTPTAVPHDTNLALVLPDSAVPVADEFWKVTSSGTDLFQYDLTAGTVPPFVVGTFHYTGQIYSFPYSNVAGFPKWGYPQTALTVAAYDSYIGLTSNVGEKLYDQWYDGSSVYWRYGALSSCLWSYAAADYASGGVHYNAQHLANGNYTLTVLMEDYSVYSFPFTVSYRGDTTSSVSFDWGEMGIEVYAERKTLSNAGKAWLYIKPKTGETIYIRDIELVAGTSDYQVEKVESVTLMDKSELNTPSLAVRTDMEITGYQIGGVRPSIPQKGQVWALVEGGYITSIQIYTGSAWESVDGRIWTGTRWVPASSYNIITLQDMYDIVDATPGYEYIYTEFGFWAWWQKAWNSFTDKLFSVFKGGTGCQHEYVSTIEKEATCTEPGRERLICSLCGAEHTEDILALEHDWLAEVIEASHSLPADTTCPDCGSDDYIAELDDASAAYSCTCSSCSASWTVQAITTEGYTLYTCSRCGETTTELDEKDSDLFEAIGNFIANGITWVTDKLKQLVDGLSGINEIFEEYTKKIQEKSGDFPAFLAAAIAFMPEDLMDVFWFSIIAAVVLAVWKKWFR